MGGFDDVNKMTTLSIYQNARSPEKVKKRHVFPHSLRKDFTTYLHGIYAFWKHLFRDIKIHLRIEL